MAKTIRPPRECDQDDGQAPDQRSRKKKEYSRNRLRKLLFPPPGETAPEMLSPLELRVIETLIAVDPDCAWLKAFGPVKNPTAPADRRIFAGLGTRARGQR